MTGQRRNRSPISAADRLFAFRMWLLAVGLSALIGGVAYAVGGYLVPLLIGVPVSAVLVGVEVLVLLRLCPPGDDR